MENLEWLLVWVVKSVATLILGHVFPHCPETTSVPEVLGYLPPWVWVSTVLWIQQDCPHGTQPPLKCEWVQPVFSQVASRGRSTWLSCQCRPCLFCPQAWPCAELTGIRSTQDQPDLASWICGAASTLEEQFSSRLLGRFHPRRHRWGRCVGMLPAGGWGLRMGGSILRRPIRGKSWGRIFYLVICVVQEESCILLGGPDQFSRSMIRLIVLALM